MSREHITELDGIRGMAILLVLLFHLYLGLGTVWLQPGRIGWCGVDLFFALSGCLITGILLDAKGSANYFRAFYGRRVLRILPLYYCVVFAFFWFLLPVAKHFHSPRPWAEIPYSEQFWYWLHISNWRTAMGFFRGEPIGHFWSLSIEEQFYLIWPFLVLRCSRRALLAVCVCIALAALGLRNLPALQAIRAHHDDLMYRLTPTRIDTLAIGACIPLIVRSPGLALWFRLRSAWLLAGSCTILLAFLAGSRSLDLNTESMSRFGFSLIAIAFGSLILHLTFTAGTRAKLATVFRSRILCSFGAYSYAIYVLSPFLNPFQRAIIKRIPSAWSPFLPALLSISLAWAAGWCSWRLLERRFLSLKRYFRYDAAAPVPHREATQDRSAAGPIFTNAPVAVIAEPTTAIEEAPPGN